MQIQDYIIFGAGIISLLIWLFVFIGGLKYNSLFDVLDESEYRLKEIYGMGYFVLELFHIQFKSKADRKLRQQLEVIYDAKYTEYYLRVIHSQQITIAMLVFVLSFVLYGLGDTVVLVFAGFAFAGVAYYYFGTTVQKKIEIRSEEMMHDFSEVVSQLALLTNAGMILREAWQEVAYAGEGTIYMEMRRAVDEMNNGMADIDAVYEFGMRCMLPEIKKFTSTIVQGLTKGNSELTAMLQEQSSEVWGLKKQLVRREGEKAASKLLIPILFMFAGILIMIIVPIFANLGV